MYKFENLNQSLIGMSKELITQGVRRSTRGFDCIEIPEPIIICVTNPCDRYINIKERKWNKQLAFVESLWIASGTNHLEMVTKYVKNMENFSDDGQFMRASYGPRVRAFSGIKNDYSIYNPSVRNIYSGFDGVVDQLKFVIESLKRDINTRQALITIHDPVKDDFGLNGELKVTKDTPCCRSLQFMMVDGKLDCTLYIRSNDAIWGYSAVNVTNFTIIQEYIANMVGVPVGKYYHIANNFHFYDDKYELVEKLSKLNPDDYKSEFGEWYYKDKIGDLNNFDYLINNLFSYEENLSKNTSKGVINFNNDLFDDWSKVFRKHWLKEDVKFGNPYLNKLFNIK